MLQAQGLTSLDITQLWALLEGAEWNPEKYNLAFVGEPPSEFDEAEGMSWASQLPDAFQRLLANLSVEQRPRIARAFSEIEGPNLSADEASEFLERLSELAQKGIASGRGLFMWETV